MALSSLNADEIISLAEKYSGEDSQCKSEVVNKILECVNDGNENEFNYTKVLQRYGDKDPNEEIFNLNTSHAIRLLETTDSCVKKASYI